MFTAFQDGVVLSLKSESAAAISAKPIRYDNGVPVFRYRKEIIRCGRFFTNEGEPFTVDTSMLDHWAKTFKLMADNRVSVPIPSDHTAVNSDGARGRIVGMQRIGDGLFAVADLVGEDAPTLAASNDVSIFSEPEWTDGEGHTYQWPIRHVALTPDPRIPGLQGFVAISAANNQTKNIPILKMDGVPMTMTVPMNGAGDGAALPTEGKGQTTGAAVPAAPKTANLKQQIKDHHVDKAKAVFANDDMGHEEKLSELARLLEQEEQILEAFTEEEESEPNEPIEAEDEGGAGAAMSGKGPALCSKAMSNRRPHVAAQPKPESNPMLLKLANKSRQQDIDNLFEKGFITKPQRDSLLAKWCGKRVALTLSNEAVEDFDSTIALLSNGYQVKTGDSFGPQTLTLANPYIDKEAEKQRSDDEWMCQPSSKRVTKPA